MKRYLALVVLVWFAAVAGAVAQTLDDQYVRVFNLIQDADSSSSAQPAQALAKYVEAQTALQRIQKTSPDWNPKVVSFRLSYVGEKIAALSAKAPPPAPGTGTNAAEKVAGKRKEIPPDWEEQVAGLRDQVKQLQADRVIMETKLKEALSLQPAENDPQELARTRQQLSQLQKEHELLKVSLDQAKSAEAADPKAVAAAQQSLADASRKLAAETARADALAQEKKTLQTKLDSMTAGAWNGSRMAGTKGEIDRLNRQLAEQKDALAKLEQDKAASEKRLKSLSADAEAVSALRAENELLKKQLAASKSAEKAGSGGNLAAQLAEARTQLAALQSDKEIWRLEKMALENRVKQLTAAAPAATSGAPVATPAPAAASADTARLQELQQERDLLRNQLESANKELASRKGKSSSPKLAELETQLANVKARLEVYEARQVPYTAEELALFTRSQPKVVEADPARKSIRELSPAAAKLAVEARQRYNSGELDKAEEAYVKLVKQDEKNVAALVNLASTQLARNNVATAEKTIQQALALAPDSAYALSVLGRVRVTQKRFDEALDAFGRAAKLDPQNPELQNFLGLTLSEKGLRGPAESALRKAVQLDPKYADAHKNLAVIYLTQTPPLAELARWHYQKALAVGAPRNPDLERMLEAREKAAAK